MRASARAAARKPKRGGVKNLLCVVASAETLPGPLRGRADRVSIILPWGSLLRGLIEPRDELVTRVRALCRSGASLEIVASYGPRDQHDEEDSLILDEAHARRLIARYQDLGFAGATVERVPLTELRGYPTTWAKRLGFGRPREVYRIRARAAVTPSDTAGCR